MSEEEGYWESEKRQADWLADQYERQQAEEEWMYGEEQCPFKEDTKLLPVRTFTEKEFVNHIKKEFCDHKCLKREFSNYKKDKETREGMLGYYGFEENMFFLTSIDPVTLPKTELEKLLHTPAIGDPVAVPGGYGYSYEPDINQFQVCYEQGAKRGYISVRSYQNYLDWQSYDPTPF